MRIKYSPLIDMDVQLQSVKDELDGTVVLHGSIKGRPAKLVMTAAEAALVYRELKKMDVEALAKVYGA